MADELRLDSTARAMIVPNEMTMDRALDLINKHHSRRQLTADDVYVMPMTLSDQTMDTYHTRMDSTTLNNYAVDFTAGRALMNSHRTGGWSSDSELPIGRTFQGEMSGVALPRTAPYEAASAGASVKVHAYIQRGLRLTDVSTDDLIRGIDGGTINDVSVGFMRGPKSQYICSICGSNLMQYESCRHVPGASYDNGRAYAWVVEFRGREASLVYKGANKNAVIDKAIRMAAEGHLSHAEALMLGDEWGVRIFAEKTFLVDKPGQTDPEPVETSTEHREEASVTWEEFLKGLRAQDAAQADRIAALDEGERLAAVMGILREQRATIDSMTTSAAQGNAWLDDLTDQAVKHRVRVESDKFDGEKYRKNLRATNDPDYIKSEIESWKRQVEAKFGTGKRPTASAQADQKPPVVPLTSYR